MTQHSDQLPYVKKLVHIIFFILCVQSFVFAQDVTLQWDANTEPDLKGYKVYYGFFSGVPYDGNDIEQGESPITIDTSELADPSNPVFKITGLDPSEYYYFALTAYDSEGLESDYSHEIFIGPDGVVGVTNGGAVGVTGAISMAENASDEEGTGCFINTSVCK